MIAYTVAGCRVICTQDDRQRRVWHCECSEFERRLVNFSEGFCVHTALAIERAIEAGEITPPLRSAR